jgi:hypothetical protein
MHRPNGGIAPLSFNNAPRRDDSHNPTKKSFAPVINNLKASHPKTFGARPVEWK